MCAQFTDDDVGKTVVNANGDDVGIVAEVDHGTAHVEPDPGITDTIKAKLGWSGRDTETYPLQEGAVAEVTGDAVRLEGDLTGTGSTDRGTSGATDTGGTHTTTTDTDVGTDRGTADEGITDDEGIIGDDEGLTDDDDDLIGDADDELLGDDEGLTDDDDDELIGDDDRDDDDII